ncbi:hypothetical protein AOLI_G00133760 [Acnodon oligacanthus]
MLKGNCLLLFLCFLFVQSSSAPLHTLPLAQPHNRPGHDWPRSLASMSTAGRSGGSGGFQRVKRGWVWNQFFVLEEYMGSDPHNQPAHVPLFMANSVTGRKQEKKKLPAFPLSHLILSLSQRFKIID